LSWQDRCIFWGLVLILVSCGNDKGGHLIRRTPVKGLPGYDVLVRKSEDPAAIIRGTAKPESQVQQETPPLKATTEASPSSKEQNELDKAVTQDLRRTRVKLRRNRNLLKRELKGAL